MSLSTLRASGLRSLFSLPRRPLLPFARLGSNATSSRPPVLSLLRSTRPPSSGSLSRTLQTRLFSSSTRRQLASPPPPPSPGGAGGEGPSTFGARLKHLFKTYGWYAVGVYFLIGTVDLGLSFAAINVFGADHVRALATRAKDAVTDALGWRRTHDEDINPKEGGKEGLWAMLVLAYALHKTVFLPFRVAGTAAITPAFVRWLRARGFAGGAGTRRAVQEMRDKVRDLRNRDRRD